MRILAVIFGAAAAVAVAGPVSADPAAGRVQLAQAQDSGSQSGSGATGELPHGCEPAGQLRPEQQRQQRCLAQFVRRPGRNQQPDEGQ